MLSNGFRRNLIGGLALAALSLSNQSSFVAQAGSPLTEASEPIVSDEVFDSPPSFRDSPYGRHPHIATPNDPAYGHPHYDCPSRYHGIWYRPRSFGLGSRQRCRPALFRPRGYGNLFNRPCTAYRLDYQAYTLQKPDSRFGPAYYYRQKDARCACCDHCAH